MQLYFIRHGQSQNNLLWDQTGSSNGRDSDPELTPLGIKQAEYLAQFLSEGHPDVKVKAHDVQNLGGFGITHLYSSLMVRAVATGSVIAEALNLPLIAWEELHEEGGIYLANEQTGERKGLPGKDRAFFEEYYPRLVLPETLREGGWWNRPFEEAPKPALRASRVLRELIERHDKTEDRVALVSHGGFYNYLLHVLFNMQNDACWFVMNNTAITRIDFLEHGVDAVYLNRLDFMPRESVS